RQLLRFLGHWLLRNRNFVGIRSILTDDPLSPRKIGVQQAGTVEDQVEATGREFELQQVAAGALEIRMRPGKVLFLEIQSQNAIAPLDGVNT
ncbi:MAG: hypothetical protein ABSG48_05270, partial [Geobacteraceae bacterium]